MKKREFQNKKRYVLAVLIATIIFLLGFTITYSLSYFEYQRISGIQQTSAFEIFSDKIKYSFFKEDLCTGNSLLEVTEDLGFQGRIIDDLERKFGKNDKSVLFQKKFYSLIELEHFEFVKMLDEECNFLNMNTILFFYSNNDADIENSEKVGRLLDTVYNENKNLIIYSFDVNLDSELIEKLKNKYNVNESPVIIINEEIKIFNPRIVNEIKKHLN